MSRNKQAVERFHLRPNNERALLVVVPLDLDEALGVIDEAGGVGAVGAVHGDAPGRG